MARGQAFVFDAYGTLFDVHSVMVELKKVTADAEAVSLQWRAKQLEYTRLRSLMGHYVDFRTVTDEALRFALRRFGVDEWGKSSTLIPPLRQRTRGRLD